MANEKKSLGSMMEHRGDSYVKGILLTVDRRYRTEKMLKEIVEFGVSYFAIMRDHSMICHPFVGKSGLK